MVFDEMGDHVAAVKVHGVHWFGSQQRCQLYDRSMVILEAKHREYKEAPADALAVSPDALLAL